MRLIEIEIAGHDVELISDRCWQAGAAGIWETDGALRVGVEDDVVAGFLALVSDLGAVDVTESTAVALAGTLVDLRIAGRSVELWVPPTVFGDGSHPTTAACLRLLDGLVRPGDQVLDVGCGAGALSISAAAHGGVVTAIDVDPDAVAATADNAVRNGIAVTASATPLSEVAGDFDLVLANMTAGALAPLVPDLVRCCRAGGALVLSGMLEAQWPKIRDAVGGTVEQVDVTDGWLTVLVRPAGS